MVGGGDLVTLQGEFPLGEEKTRQWATLKWEKVHAAIAPSVKPLALAVNTRGEIRIPTGSRGKGESNRSGITQNGNMTSQFQKEKRRRLKHLTGRYPAVHVDEGTGAEFRAAKIKKCETGVLTPTGRAVHQKGPDRRAGSQSSVVQGGTQCPESEKEKRPGSRE